MRAVLSAIVVGAILFMVGCGATTEQKNTIKAQGDRIAALEKSISDLQKTNLGLQAKNDSVESYIKTHFKGFGEAETPQGTVTPAPQTPAKSPEKIRDRVKTTPKKTK